MGMLVVGTDKWHLCITPHYLLCDPFPLLYCVWRRWQENKWWRAWSQEGGDGRRGLWNLFGVEVFPHSFLTYLLFIPHCPTFIWPLDPITLYYLFPLLHCVGGGYSWCVDYPSFRWSDLLTLVTKEVETRYLFIPLSFIVPSPCVVVVNIVIVGRYSTPLTPCYLFTTRRYTTHVPHSSYGVTFDFVRSFHTFCTLHLVMGWISLYRCVWFVVAHVTLYFVLLLLRFPRYTLRCLIVVVTFFLFLFIYLRIYHICVILVFPSLAGDLSLHSLLRLPRSIPLHYLFYHYVFPFRCADVIYVVVIVPICYGDSLRYHCPLPFVPVIYLLFIPTTFSPLLVTRWRCHWPNVVIPIYCPQWVSFVLLLLLLLCLIDRMEWGDIVGGGDVGSEVVVGGSGGVVRWWWVVVSLYLHYLFPSYILCAHLFPHYSLWWHCWWPLAPPVVPPSFPHIDPHWPHLHLLLALSVIVYSPLCPIPTLPLPSHCAQAGTNWNGSYIVDPP